MEVITERMTNIVYRDLTSLEKTLEIKPVGSNLYHCSVLLKKKREISNLTQVLVF